MYNTLMRHAARCAPTCRPQRLYARRGGGWWPALAVGALALLPLPTAAADLGARGSSTASPAPTMPVVRYDRSCERTAATQLALDECAASELHQVQRQLGAALVAQTRAAGLSQRHLDAAAQSGFLAYEKAECLASASPDKGGSIYPMVLADCELRLSVQRLQELRVDAAGMTGPG